MRLFFIKFLQLRLFLSLLCGISFAMANYTPQWTQRYQVSNNTGVAISKVAVSDYVMYTGDDVGIYHDPEFDVDTMQNNDVYPTYDNLAKGGMVSYLGGATAHWNSWSVSYCIRGGSTCYSNYSQLGNAHCDLDNGTVSNEHAKVEFKADKSVVITYLDMTSGQIENQCTFPVSPVSSTK